MPDKKRVPTALRLLQNSHELPGGRVNHDEPEVMPRALPAPKHIDDMARQEWKRVAKHLAKVGLLTDIDRAALEGYCVNWSRWHQAEEHIRREGETVATPNGYLQQSVHLSISNRCQRQMRDFMCELGMTPSSRSRVKLHKADAEVSEAYAQLVERQLSEFDDADLETLASLLDRARTEVA